MLNYVYIILIIVLILVSLLIYIFRGAITLFVCFCGMSIVGMIQYVQLKAVEKVGKCCFGQWN